MTLSLSESEPMIRRLIPGFVRRIRFSKANVEAILFSPGEIALPEAQRNVLEMVTSSTRKRELGDTV